MIALGKKSLDPASARDDAHWTPPIVRCVAVRNEGVAELGQGLATHRIWLQTTKQGAAHTRERLLEQVRNQLTDALAEAAEYAVRPLIDEALAEVASRQTDPYSACERIVKAFRKSG